MVAKARAVRQGRPLKVGEGLCGPRSGVGAPCTCVAWQASSKLNSKETNA